MSIYRGRNKHEVYLASLLYDAIEDSDLRSVQTLLAVKGADPNLVLPRKKISPFHLIIGNDSDKFALDATLLILQNGGNPNVQSDDGLTPIHIAAAWGRHDLLKLLLDCGGNPEIRDINKKTALHYAMEEKFLDCYELLKIYVMDKAGVMCREKEDCVNYVITLDKILINNGDTIGEYEIVKEYRTDSIYKRDFQLQSLPHSNSKEYVINWFNSQDKMLNSTGNTTGISEDSGDSLKESDEERHSYVNSKSICFRKVYRKKIRTPKKEYSKESGLSFFESTRRDLSLDVEKRPSSDYVTCTSGSSPDVIERNIFDFDVVNDETSKSLLSVNTKSEGISSTDLSFVSMSEVYKYVDQEEGIVMYEKRVLKTPPILSDRNGSVKSFVSSKHSLPESIDYENYDSDTLKKELTHLGYNPGPITVTTKRIYLKKLSQLKKNLPLPKSENNATVARVYSAELERTLRFPDWLKDVTCYKTLDESVLRQFSTPDSSKRWREGNNKSCFTYLLLDPRITSNLPSRADSLKSGEIWETFLSAIFYVGKGTRSRPYNHLYDAVHLWNQGQRQSDNVKLNKILDIWKDGCGVVCLHLFQNVIPVEAYTREAAIIEALGRENLSNAKAGNFYGVAATWGRKEKCMLGVFLLYKAMVIFLNEGERQLCPSDIN